MSENMQLHSPGKMLNEQRINIKFLLKLNKSVVIPILIGGFGIPLILGILDRNILDAN